MALDVGISLLKQCSRSTFPRMPCGIVRLNRLKGIEGFARSRSQASRFVSVRVTLGGGLKVLFVVMVP